MKTRVALVLVAVVAMMAITALPVYAQETRVHVVRWGDTLYGIAHRYGTSVKAIMAENGLRSTRIYVGQRLTIPAARPGSGTVDGWTGRIVKLGDGAQHGEYFERDDGERFGIGGASDAMQAEVNEFRWTGAWIRVWGWLRTDVPSYAGQAIVAERIEAISGPVPVSRDLTAFASVLASSHLRTDRWGQYQPPMAVDGRRNTGWAEGVRGSGAGEWIMLTFPEPVEVHSVGLNVGLDSSSDIFYRNNRIKRVTLVFSSGEQLELGFADRRGMQTIPLVRAPGPNIETTFIKIVIEDVFPGWKYDDTCLAEVEVWGIGR